MKIAVIGAGISGNLAARLLATRHEVDLYEAGAYAGGHTNTIDVPTPDGPVAVDTGFMVFNRRTYPTFCQLLEHLGVESQPSDMSFSVRCDTTGLEYNGSSLDGLFAQRGNLLRPGFYRMLRDILRFNRAGEQYATSTRSDQRLTLGEFLQTHRIGRAAREKYLVPMLAAIWSATPSSVESLPARFILGFMHNHGLMQLRDRPQWRTITGGARNYVARLLEPLGGRVHLNSPVTRIERTFDGAVVELADGRRSTFDAVVLATHADQSLAILADASADERDILSAFPYQPNTAVLHSDPSPMPRRRKAWASWNYRLPALHSSAPTTASVTYDLNRLQNLPSRIPIFVTLNPTEPIRPDAIHRTIAYQHPAYDLQSVAAQQRWQDINGARHTWYCGAYWGYGFHEDGAQSALRVANAFGIELADVLAPVVTPGRHAQPAGQV